MGLPPLPALSDEGGQEAGPRYYRDEVKTSFSLNSFLFSPLLLVSTKPNPNQIISVGSKPGMNGAGFQKGLTCESCHSEFPGGSGRLGVGRVCPTQEPEGSGGVPLPHPTSTSSALSATQSAQWYAWGPPNMQCRLCASCWIYWKKYGGLKTPTQLEGAARATTVRTDGAGGEESGILVWT